MNKILMQSIWGTVCTFLLLLSQNSHAQTMQSNYGAPTSPVQVGDGPAVFKIRINGSSSACSAASALNITLPIGYVYVSNSASIIGGTGNITQTSISGNTATLSVTNIPATPDSTVITYKAYAGCGVIGGNNTTINYSLNSCAGTVTAIDNVNTQNAQLNITGITNSAYVGSFGETYTRTITVANNGNGTIDTIYLDSKNGLGLSVSSTTANTGNITITKSWTATDSTYRYRIVAPTADGHLSKGETIVFTEQVKIISCANATSTLKAWFGPNSIECSAISNSATAGATINTAVQPNVVSSIITNPVLTCLPTDANTGWVVFQTKNTSAVPALVSVATSFSYSSCHACAGGVSPSIGAGGNSCASRTMYIDTAAGVQYSTNGGVTWSNVDYTVFQWYNNWPAGGGYHDGKPLTLRFPNLKQINGGDSIRIKFKLYDESPPCCQGTWIQGGVALGVSYTDICGANLKNAEGITTNTLASQKYSMASSSSADAVAGQPFTLSFAGIIVQGHNASRTNLTDGYLDYVITLPTVLDPSLLPADNKISKGTNSISPDLVSFDAATRKLTLRFLRSTLNSFVTGDVGNWTLSSKTTVNCNGTGNSATLNAYVKLAGCTTAEWQAICDITANFVVHGCNAGSCVGPLNYPTTAFRTNYGTYAGANDGQPGGTLNTNLMNLHATLDGDTVAVTTKAKIVGSNSYSNIFVTIDKTAVDSVHKFVDAKAYIYNTAGALTATITNISAGTIAGTQPSTRILSISGTGTPALFLPGDSIVVVTRFKQNTSTTQRIDFTTTTYSSNSSTFNHSSQVSCDGKWTATVYNYGVYISSSDGTTILFTECSPGTAGTVFSSVIDQASPAATRHARFPYEIRETMELDTLTINVPVGFEIEKIKITVSGQGTVANTGIDNYPLLAYNPTSRNYYYSLSDLADKLVGAGIPFSEGYNLTVTPTFKVICQKANFNAGTANVRLKYKLMDSDWATRLNVFYMVSNNSTFNPLAVSSPSPNLTVNSNKAGWVVQISNPTILAKPNVWLAEAAGLNGTTISSVEELSGPSGTVLSTATVANGIYQLGNLAANTTKYFRVNADFDNCVQDSINLVIDYNCSAYPTNIVTAEAGCKPQFLPLKVIVQTAALQLAVLTQPTGTVNLCDPLTYAMEVTNSGLGAADTLAVRVILPITGGISYVLGSFGMKYPTTAASYTSIADANIIGNTPGSNVLLFRIPASQLATLPGTDKMGIQFQMKTNSCEFTSGEKLAFTPEGKNGCNENIHGTSVGGLRINITGAPTILPKFTITSKVDSLIACGTSSVTTTYRFKIINTGTSATTVNDGFRIKLPAPWTLNPSVLFSHNVSGATYSTSPVAQVYDFKTGNNLSVGDSVVFAATITAIAANVACGTSLPIVENAFVEFAATCTSSNLTCSTKQLLEPENAMTTILVKRPNYNLTAFTAAAAGSPLSHVSGSLTINNTNSTAAAQNGTLKIYKDVNADGVLNAGDLLIGSQSYAISTQPTQSFNYDITSSIAGNICPIIARLEMDCNCDTIQFVHNCASIVLPIKFAKEKIKANGCTVSLSWEYEATNTMVTSFGIERKRATSNSWDRIAIVNKEERQYIDETPIEGIWLYRILAWDTERQIAYSPTLKVNTDCKKSGIQIYPNPTSNILHIDLPDNDNIQATYLILDKLGRTVQKGMWNGNRKNSIQLNALAAGLYHIRILYGVTNWVEKFEIVR